MRGKRRHRTRTEGDGGTVCGTGGLGFRVGAAAEQPPWRGCLAQDRKEFRLGLDTRIPRLVPRLVWPILFVVKFFSRYPRDMAGYGGIYGGIPRDTGYREIPGDTRYGRIRADTGRYGEIRGDAMRCKEIRGDTVRYCRDTSRYRKKTVRTRAKERKQTTQGVVRRRGLRRRSSPRRGQTMRCAS